jgi:hypothetical protein
VTGSGFLMSVYQVDLFNKNTLADHVSGAIDIFEESGGLHIYEDRRRCDKLSSYLDNS